MNNLTKIKDMSSKYGISARTLRYYEDMGLIVSTRVDGYAYRLYDETAAKKLEQILILRKLSVSIKDINRIFNSSGCEIVLDVLSKKVNDIDSEVSLLYELKEIIFTFICYIKDVDFNKDSDVKMLYDKAKEIEAQITNVEYEGRLSSTKELLAVTNNPNRHIITDCEFEKMELTYFDDEPEEGYSGKHSFTDQGELVIVSKGFEESDYIGLQSSECFRLPLRMDAVAKSSGEIWLHYNKGGLAINHDTDGLYYLHANDIFTGRHTSYSMERIPLNDYTEISWVLDFSEGKVYINGEHFHTHVWHSAVPFAEKQKIFAPVDVTAGNANTVTVKSIRVTETQITMSNITRLIEVTEKLDSERITLPLAIRAYRFSSRGAMRFIGKKYPGEKEARKEWEQKGLYKALESHLSGIKKDFYEDGDAPIGLMNMREGFEYWLGYFTPRGTVVPKGFECEDFPKWDLGVCWIYGKSNEIYMEGIEDIAWQKLEREGFKQIPDSGWWMERYPHKRCGPDKMGYAISDICFFVK